MKILHITDDAGSVGGVQTYLRDLCEILPEAGIDSEVWRPSQSGGVVADHLTRWAGRGYERKLSSRLERDRPAIVHAHNLWMRLSPMPLRAAKKAGIPVVMTVHDYNFVCPRKWMITADGRPCDSGFGGRCLVSNCRGSREGWGWLPYNNLRWLKTALHRRMLRSWVDVFVCPSLHLGAWMRRSLGVERVHHVANFTRRPAGDPAPATDPHRLLFAGRLSREKGVDVLLRAMPLLLEEHPRAYLTIAGDGPERAALEQLALTLGVKDAVQFIGPLATGELDEQYRQSGIFVLPTLWMENCPVAVLEALANGRAVVATRIGGVPELVEDGMTGLLVQRGDHHDLARRLSSLVGNPARVEEMGRRASAAFNEAYTVEGHVDRLLAIYGTAAAGDDPASCSAAQ